DETVPAPPANAALLHTVRRRAKRRTAVRAALSIGTLSAVLLAGVWLADGPMRTQPVAVEHMRPGTHIANDVESLNALAESHELCAARLLSGERAAAQRIRTAEALNAPGPMEELTAASNE